jgi:hypothetical protein
MKELTKSDIKVGMKVIPHSKTPYGINNELLTSVVYGRAKRQNQPFLYVTGWEDKDTLILDYDMNHNSGDFYGIHDITLYEPSYKCIKSFPGVNEGEVFKGPFDNEEFYQNKEYFSIVLPTPLPVLIIENYDFNIDRKNQIINWGCRGFNFSDFEKIVNTFNMISNANLCVGVGRSLPLKPIDIGKLNEILNYIKNC